MGIASWLVRPWQWVRATRGRRWAAAALAAGALAAAVLWLVPTPYYITAPGSAIDARRLVRVPGAVDPDPPGRFLVLTVLSRPANLLLYLYGRTQGDRVRLERQEEYLGLYPDPQQLERDMARMMADSRRLAAAAALRALGYPVALVGDGVSVSAVLRDSPARGILQAGDVLVGLGDRPLTAARDLLAALAAVRPGEAVALRVERGGQILTLQVPTAPAPDRPGAALRVLVADRVRVDLPVAVEIDPGRITGPSAGLIFALEVVDQLTAGDLTGGRVVAGTGGVDAEGRVTPVGGVRQKVLAAEAAGAQVVLVPEANRAEAEAAATRAQVVPVSAVAGALEWLRSHAPRR